MLKPLYVYRINEEEGKVEKHVITEYKETNSAYEYDHCFTGDYEGSYVTYKKNLDFICNGKLHTFNPDEKKAKGKMLDYIYEKANRHKKEAKRWGDLLNNVMKEEQ